MKTKHISKIGLIFTILILSLASISISYSAWTDTITMQGTVNTMEDFNYLCMAGFWNFNEGIGTTAHDSSINHNNGTIHGGSTWVSLGAGGYALEFNGVDGYVSVPDSPSLDISGIITVEGWVYVNNYGPGRFYTIAGKWNDRDGNYRSYLLGLSTFGAGQPQPRFYVSTDGSNYPSADSSDLLDVGVWYHLAGTFDGNVLKIYVNGVEKGSYTFASPTSIALNNEPLLISGDRAGGINGRFFDGAIDNVKIYTCVLTPDEILADYNAGH